MPMSKRAVAEFLGTLWLVLGGCGSAVLAAAFPDVGIGPAVFVGDWALGQLWLFWVAPMLGALVAGYLYRWLGDEK